MNNLKKTLTEKISQTIETQRIRPIPRGIFVIQRLLIWFILLFSIIISAATLSMIIFRVSRLGHLPYENISTSFPNQFLDMVPIIFITTLVIGVIVAIYEFGKTDSGYKFEKLKVTFFVTFLIILLGIIFSYLGINHFVHRFIVERGRIAPTVEEIKNKRFNNPERGVIVGVVQNQILTNQLGKKINLFRGENLDKKDFLSIDNLEQPVILFGKPIPEGFIVCKLSKPKKNIGLNFKSKKTPIDIKNCKQSFE